MNKRYSWISLVVVGLLAFVVIGCNQLADQEQTETETAVGQIPQVNYTYVANAADGTVSAVDLVNEQVVWTLKIGERAAHGIAASPDAGIVYAGDAAARELVVIDAGQQAVIKRIPLSTAVHGIDISPDGRTLWVGGALDNDPVQGTLTVIDTASLTIEDVISPGLGSASHFTFTPDGREVWIASTSTNLVWIVDTNTRQVVAVVPLSLPEAEQRPLPGDDWDEYLAERQIIGLNEVAISPDGTRAYAVGPTTSELFVIDVAGRHVLNNVTAGERAHGVSVSPDGREVWVADWAGVVNVFDAQSLEQLATIQVANPGGQAVQGANHVAFSPDGVRIYVSSIDQVVVIDAARREVTQRLAVGQEPHEFSLKAWVLPEVQAVTTAVRLVAVPEDVAVSEPNDSVGDASPGADNAELTQVNNQGAVTIAITPLNLQGSDTTLDFQVALDTHAVDLDYDLTGLAVLRDSQGNEYLPAAWDGPQGGHHVSGILRFNGRTTILAAGSTYLELEVKDVARIPSRLFRWEIE
jgi:YVTN family beta-propeller protein